LKREYFDNELTLSKLNDKEWEDILYIIEKLDIKTFQEYHDFCLNILMYSICNRTSISPNSFIISFIIFDRASLSCVNE
jgi:hypothetical protein